MQRRQGIAYKGPKEGPASGQGRQWVRDQTEAWRSVLMPAHCFSEVSLGWPVSLSTNLTGGKAWVSRHEDEQGTKVQGIQLSFGEQY